MRSSVCYLVTPAGNDLHALHIIVGGEGISPEAEAWEWRNPLCTGAPPPAREMHAAALLGRTLLVHGGRGGPHAAAALQLQSIAGPDLCPGAAYPPPQGATWRLWAARHSQRPGFSAPSRRLACSS